MRGWSSGDWIGITIVCILPAYAGVIPRFWDKEDPNAYSSRVCGGDPQFQYFCPLQQQFFPRMRGWSSECVTITYKLRILPAYAGVILLLFIIFIVFENSSRVCGGDPVIKTAFNAQFEFFPRMRGWSYHIHLWSKLISILPAYAGVIPLNYHILFYSYYSSRVCGGDPETGLMVSDLPEFFPRMRGWSRILPELSAWLYILPAYAGVILLLFPRQ